MNGGGMYGGGGIGGGGSIGTGGGGMGIGAIGVTLPPWYPGVGVDPEKLDIVAVMP